MRWPMGLATVWFAAVNLAAFCLYGADKRRARRDEWRIPEKTLLGIAALGGFLGAWAGMRVWRHKTRKPVFVYGVPLIALAWAVAAALVMRLR